MVTEFNRQHPSNVRETIDWLLRLGRPPLPECPIEAVIQGKDPKQPCFLDGRYLKVVNWKPFQRNQPAPAIINAWFSNPKTGIGTLGGWNGKHWLGWIDFDQKDFLSPEECDRAVNTWVKQYPIMATAPMFRTPSGGYRFLVAFSREPENFKANSGFSLNPDGSHHVGELLTKNGGHTLLPPTVGVNGTPYHWACWSEYPPVVEQPEDVGLYLVQKRTEGKPVEVQPIKTDNPFDSTNTYLAEFLQREIYPRLSAEIAFSWSGHNFKASGNKLRGNCLWHESQSGTAFYVDRKDGVYLWRCPACEIGGGVIEYRHRLNGGNGSPRGKDFVDIVRQLADDVGVSMPTLERDRTPRSTLYQGKQSKGVDPLATNVSNALTLEAAVDQAKEVLKAGHPELIENIELEKIRSACGISSYDWERKLIKPLKRELNADRFRLDLLNLLTIEDEVECIRQQALLAPKYQMSSGTIHQALQLIKQHTTTPKLNCLSLDRFLDLESEGLRWLISELLPLGETIILAGPPKCGKTLFAIDVAFAVATGEESFLGESVTAGRVLIVSVDESIHSTKAKLLKRGFRHSDAPNVQVMTKFDIRQIKALEERLEVFRPHLVIIDSLRRINHGIEVSENSANFADNIYTLKEILTQYGASGILIHHTSKSQEALGVSKIRGSSAIAGAVWGTWQLEHIPKPDPNHKKKLSVDPKDQRRILSVFARDTEGQQIQIELDLENNRWINQGLVGESSDYKQEHATLKSRIINILARNSHQPGLSGREIIELLEMNSEEGRSVYTTLNRMVNKRLISCRPALGDRRYNIYSLPCQLPTLLDARENNKPLGSSDPTPNINASHYPPSPTSYVPNDDYCAETLTAQEFPIVNKLVNNYSTNSQQPLVDEYLLNNSNPDATSNAVDSQHCDLIRGEGVANGIAKVSPISTQPAAVPELLPTPHQSLFETVTVSEAVTKLKVGDRVQWDECPAHCSCFNPFTIHKIEESKAWLEFYSQPVPLEQLRRSL